MKKQDNVLTGKGNKRLNNTDPLHEQNTAAIADAQKVISETQMTIPSTLNVVNAKDWVDDGSRL